jgi:DNA-binding PadR family transcriptional regulator
MFKHFMHEKFESRCAGGKYARERMFNGEDAFEGGPRGFGGPGWGRHGRFGGRGEGFGGPFGRGGFGGGRERMFDGGAMRLVILQLLNEEPSYGYQLIKRLEERMAGGYTPSAGVIYPTLTMLEEQNLIAPTTNEAGKKVFAVTDEGKAFLKENKERIAQLESLMNAAGRGFGRERAPEIMQAFMNLRGAMKARLSREGISPEQVKKIAEAINAAAKAIDAL